MFIAFKGENDDGHNYVNRAIKEGASLILVSKKEAAEHVVGLASRKGCAAILVPDTLKALHDIARKWLEIIQVTVIGITGSTGKTSTKEMMACVLGQRFKVAYTHGNQNNEIGVPLTVLGAEEGDEILIVEMGMRGKGQITELCDIVSPTIGVVTSVGPSHIELLGTIDDIVEAKGELLRAIPQDGLCVFEASKPYTERFADWSPARYMTVGIDSDDAKIMATKVKLDSSGCPSAHVMSLKDSYDITLNVAGLHQLSNALLVIAVAQELGVAGMIIEKGLSQAKLTGMRFRIDINRTTEVIVINDAYNANPNSMEQAVWTLASMEVIGRRVCILGDMLELGDITADEHYRIGQIVASAGIDALFSYGDYSADMIRGAHDSGLAVARAYDWIELDLLIDDTKAFMQAGDCALVKASRAMELERVAYALLDIEMPAQPAPYQGDDQEGKVAVDQPTEPLQAIDANARLGQTGGFNVI
jgi:UDP-N-acetylmuramoyl-tripeptide--D-alanyl-D-alanine ligase